MDQKESSNLKLAGIGDNCVDIYLSLGRVFPGGGPVNVAAHAQRLGAVSSYIGVIGNDQKGQLIRDSLLAEQVNVDCLEIVEGPTAEARVKHTADGDRVFCGSDHGVREQLIVTNKVSAFLAQHDLVHTTLDGKMDDELQRFKQLGLLISYDYSHRYTDAQFKMTFPFVDFLFFSGSKFSMAEAESRLRKLGDMDPKKVLVMTMGVNGSLAVNDGKYYYQAAVKTKTKATDTLGAGDSYIAAFLVGFLKQTPIKKCMENAADYAAEVCGEYGAFGHGVIFKGCD
jgi:fructoselysine 6-kinase